MSGGTASRRCWRYQCCNTRSRSVASVSGRTWDAAVRSKAQDGWRSNPFKAKAVKNAIKAVVNDDHARADEVFELVKNQSEY